MLEKAMEATRRSRTKGVEDGRKNKCLAQLREEKRNNQNNFEQGKMCKNPIKILLQN